MNNQLSILLPRLPCVLASQYLLLPKNPGVYFFLDENKKLLYIGKAVSLVKRVGSYFKAKDLLIKTQLLVSQITEIKYLVTETEFDALLLEANLIRKFQPFYNSQFKDNKSFPLIKITKEEYPRIIVTRKEVNDGSVYFGPYPTGSNITYLLCGFRRIFPFVSEKHRKGEKCFRSHLGLCPCPLNPEIKIEYMKTIKKLKSILSGQRTKVYREMEQDMIKAAKVKDFERASIIKLKLDSLNWLGSGRFRPWDYEENPNLNEDLKKERVRQLAEVIPQIKYKDNFRLECFDISHTGRMQTTASLVVFTDGEKDSKWYRKFRIRKPLSDDYSSMVEAVSRRLMHKNWPLPDLLVVDGGAPQVTAALEAMEKTRVWVPVIGLAKRLETIYLANRETVQLLRTHSGLQLLQQVRDEAHRFARRYHFLLRTRKMLE